MNPLGIGCRKPSLRLTFSKCVSSLSQQADDIQCCVLIDQLLNNNNEARVKLLAVFVLCLILLSRYQCAFSRATIVEGAELRARFSRSLDISGRENFWCAFNLKVEGFGNIRSWKRWRKTPYSYQFHDVAIWWKTLIEGKIKSILLNTYLTYYVTEKLNHFIAIAWEHAN